MSGTATEIGLDLEILFHLEMEDQPPCELFAGEDCPDPGTWTLRHRCCGATWTCCAAHRIIYNERDKAMLVQAARGITFTCNACGQHVLPVHNTIWELTKK